MYAPKVFISYSWDNQAHKDWVRHLADKLIANGVDAILDQYEVQAGDNVTYFMERSITKMDKVLLILTENYKLKADGRGGGVGYEYSMINAEWYSNQTDNNRFIPVLRGKDILQSKPVFVHSIIHIDMSDDTLFEEKFRELLHWVYDESILEKPALGKRPDFAQATTPIQVQQKVNQLRDLIARGKTDMAIQQLLYLADQLADSDYQTQVIMQVNAYEHYQKSKRMGITSHSEQQVSLAKINYALLELINSYVEE